MAKYLISAFLLSVVLFNACNGLRTVKDSDVSISDSDVSVYDGCPMQPLVMCIMQAPILCKSDLECGVGSRCCPSSCGGASCLVVETEEVSIETDGVSTETDGATTETDGVSIESGEISTETDELKIIYDEPMPMTDTNIAY
jgi:hypothetical protein